MTAAPRGPPPWLLSGDMCPDEHAREDDVRRGVQGEDQRHPDPRDEESRSAGPTTRPTFTLTEPSTDAARICVRGTRSG